MNDCGNINCGDHYAEYDGACSRYIVDSKILKCPDYKPCQQTSTVSEILTKIDQEREAAAKEENNRIIGGFHMRDALGEQVAAAAAAKEEKAKFNPFWIDPQVFKEKPMAPISREEWDKKVDSLEAKPPRQVALGDCLDEAKACITGERQDQYGNPEDSFALIADYWRTYLNQPVTALDVAHMMILFKVARCQGQEPKRDNYTDICGYSSIAADRIMEAKS